MALRCRVVTFICAVVAVLISYVPMAIGGDSIRPISAEELKMTSEPLAPGAPAIILYRQVDRDDNGLTGHENNFVRIKIFTEEARKYADVEIPFLKGDGSGVTGIKARTIRPDGSSTSFDGKVYEKSIVKAQGVRYVAKTFTLPDVQVGSIIEYSYTVDFPEYFLFDSHWILSHELFTKRAVFSLKPYGNMVCRWSWQRLPEGTAQPKAGGDKIVRLEANNIPAFPTEDFMPPENELKSRVDFTYSESRLEGTPAQFWKNRGKELNSRLESFIGKPKAMQQAVSEIVSPNDTPEVKLQKIYARVQQLRNTSFEKQKTEQESKREKQKTANNVEEVWTSGYGNGVQLTWLFLAMARAAGFEAYGVWASDRRNYFFNPALMDGSKLNENVVLVKLNGEDAYFDPGSAFTPFRMLPWPETGVRGLRLDKDGGEWVTTTLPSSSASRIVRNADLHLTETGNIEGVLKITFTGIEASRLRVEQRHADDADRKKFLEDLVKEQIPAAAEVELSNKPDWNSSSPMFVAEFKVTVPGWMSGAGRRAMFPVGIFTAQDKQTFVHSGRVHPIYFEFPFGREDDVTITLPLGWEISSLPRIQTEGEGSSVLYAFKAENNHGVLHLNRKLNVDLLLLGSEYYGVLRNFFQTVRTGDEEQVVLQPIGARASN